MGKDSLESINNIKGMAHSCLYYTVWFIVHCLFSSLFISFSSLLLALFPSLRCLTWHYSFPFIDTFAPTKQNIIKNSHLHQLSIHLFFSLLPNCVEESPQTLGSCTSLTVIWAGFPSGLSVSRAHVAKGQQQHIRGDHHESHTNTHSSTFYWLKGWFTNLPFKIWLK